MPKMAAYDSVVLSTYYEGSVSSASVRGSGGEHRRSTHVEEIANAQEGKNAEIQLAPQCPLRVHVDSVVCWVRLERRGIQLMAGLPNAAARSLPVAIVPRMRAISGPVRNSRSAALALHVGDSRVPHVVFQREIRGRLARSRTRRARRPPHLRPAAISVLRTISGQPGLRRYNDVIAGFCPKEGLGPEGGPRYEISRKPGTCTNNKVGVGFGRG